LKKIKRKLPNTRKYTREINFSTEPINEMKISYDENDFLSISKLKVLKNKIRESQYEKEIDHLMPMISKDIIMKRKNLTNLYDFEHIIKKLIENNNTIEQKFIEL